MSNKKLPLFKYHPKPLSSGVFEEWDGECTVCHSKNGYRYVGPFYSVTEVENICPWCIKNGLAAKQHDLTFVDENEIDGVDDESFIEELTERTPGYFFPQEDNWPAHCDDYCILFGQVCWNDIKDKLDELESDLKFIQDSLEITQEVFIDELKRDDSPLWVTLFKCHLCGSLKMVADYE